jgi:hypothetical protein
VIEEGGFQMLIANRAYVVHHHSSELQRRT